jgi:uroporphyrinogen decarboxylase
VSRGKCMMKPKERVLTAMDHQQPDRVPVDFWWSHETRDRLLTHFRLKDTEQLQQFLGSDIRCIYPPYIGPKLARFADGSYEDFWGVIRKPYRHSGGEYDEVVFSPLANATSIEDIERIRWPDPDWFDYEVLEQMCGRYENYAIMVGRMGIETQTIFIQTWFLRGLERALMDLAECPELVEALVKKIMKFRIEHVKRILAVVQGRAEILQIADDYGMQAGLMMSPAVWRRIFAPPLKTLCDLIHDAGLKVFLHCCGSSRKIIPDLIALGIDILNPIQVRAAGMDAKALKEDFGDKLCFHGAIDTQETLPRGSKEDIISEVRERIEVMGRSGGYILAPVHTVESDVPIENILTLYEAVREHGKYT